MAQRTAFLNSDAKGYNKDFHHTWIENYMLKQPGVMFSNYSTKPEFALGNGQIAGGKAIIRCTRTTGTFAGEEILASFESTTTENISTSGDKKVFIEIPEVYVNDSTAITDTLTQGVNLGVGRIVSASDYPTHSNYIPLWEITGGDWQNATDVRPEILRRGKPNTISYFGGNGEEERIDIDNSSLNKYLMSNGAGVAPSWEEGGGGGGGSGENFKRTFTADEDLLAKSMFGVETLPTVSNIDASIEFGTTEIEKLFFTTILNGEDFSSIVLNLKSVNSPSDSLSIRIETLDANGKPSGTLVDVGAYGTVSPTSTATDTTISLSGTVTGLTAHTKVAVVISRSGTASDSNYYELGCLDDTNVITAIQEYDGSVWSGGYVSGCITCAGFASDAVVQATSLNGVEPVGYCETGATAGNDFTGILAGTVDYTGATAGTKYYLGTTGTLSTTGAKLVGKGLEGGVLQFVGAASGQSVYDAIVAADGSGDYTTLYAAITAGKRNIYIKEGIYLETPVSIVDDTFYITGAGQNLVNLNYSITANSYQIGGACITFSTSENITTSDIIYNNIKGVTFNITEDGANNDLNGYVVNSYSVSKAQYFLNISDCSINVTQTGAAIIFREALLGRGYANIINCNISVTNNSYNTTYESIYGGTHNYLGCNVEVKTTSNNDVYAEIISGMFNNGYINITTSGTGNAELFSSNIYNTSINIKGTSNNTAGLTLQDSCGCKVSMTKPRNNLNGLSYSTVVEDWKSSTSYNSSTFVHYNGLIYKCNTAHTSGDSFDYNYRDTIKGIKISNVNNSELAISGIIYIRGIFGNNTIKTGSYYILSTSQIGNVPGPIMTGNSTISGNKINWIKSVTKNIIISNNNIKTQYGIRYRDDYAIIKDNILVADASGDNPSVSSVGTTTSTSKVSDNITYTF